MKCAIIDLGSNTIRLSVYQIFTPLEEFAPHVDLSSRPTPFERLFSKKEMVGLVSYIHDGILSQEGIDKASNTLNTFRSLIRQFNVDQVRTFATASLRNIANTEEALFAIQENTGFSVEVISGHDEAIFGYYGARYATKLEDALLFDIGGGSTELLEVQNGAIFASESLAMGSLNLFTGFVSQILPRENEIEAMQQHIDALLDKADMPKAKLERIYGIGGTARAAMRMINDSCGRNRDENIFTPEELKNITEILISRSDEAKRLIIKNCPDRIHTVVPGILIMNTLSERLGPKDIFISKYGVREGYLCHKTMNP